MQFRDRPWSQHGLAPSLEGGVEGREEEQEVHGAAGVPLRWGLSPACLCSRQFLLPPSSSEAWALPYTPPPTPPEILIICLGAAWTTETSNAPQMVSGAENLALGPVCWDPGTFLGGGNRKLHLGTLARHPFPGALLPPDRELGLKSPSSPRIEPSGTPVPFSALYLLNRFLLSIYCRPGTVLSIRVIAMN